MESLPVIDINTFSPGLAKDYIASKCSQEQYDYDLCERCSRSIVHTVDALRTAISALKIEKEYSNYSANLRVS